MNPNFISELKINLTAFPNPILDDVDKVDYQNKYNIYIVVPKK